MHGLLGPNYNKLWEKDEKDTEDTEDRNLKY